MVCTGRNVFFTINMYYKCFLTRIIFHMLHVTIIYYLSGNIFLREGLVVLWKYSCLSKPGLRIFHVVLKEPIDDNNAK